MGKKIQVIEKGHKEIKREKRQARKLKQTK